MGWRTKRGHENRGKLSLSSITWDAWVWRYPIKKITAIVTLIVLFCYLMTFHLQSPPNVEEQEKSRVLNVLTRGQDSVLCCFAIRSIEGRQDASGKNSQYSSSLNHAHLISKSLRPGTSLVSASA